MNRLSVYDVDLGRKELRLTEEFQLSREEDAPMTVALHRNVLDPFLHYLSIDSID